MNAHKPVPTKLVARTKNYVKASHRMGQGIHRRVVA
jgi:hypothetical protein